MSEIIPIISSGDRSAVLDHIARQRQIRPGFSVIDVGGSAVGWSAGVVTAIIDINPSRKGDFRFFRANISREEDWKAVDDYVREKGLFDFSICTHTLEDIANPQLVCRKLSMISKGGYIAVPSKYVEMARFQKVMLSGLSYRGFIHHRWVFTVRDGTFWGFPKVPFIEQDPFFDLLGDSLTISNHDMSFFWQAPLSLQIVNNDYLGPNVDAVISYYHDQMIRDDVDRVAGVAYG